MAGRARWKPCLFMETNAMKMFLTFVIGVLIGAYFNGQIIQKEAIQLGYAMRTNNVFKWKGTK